MTPWLEDTDCRLFHGDALEVLRSLPSGSVHMCATSPPFYGLRSYVDDDHPDKPLEIGLEETPDEWVARLVAVFREVRRVLRDDGTLWVEIGDSYASQGGPEPAQTKWQVDGASNTQAGGKSRTPGQNKPKDLLGQPWLLAFALRADGWYLRSEIIWARPNPMPESVTDRPTKSHSTVFLLSKRPRYFWDADAIREAYARVWDPATNGGSMATGRHDAAHIGGSKRHERPYPVPNAPKPVPQVETLDGSAGESPRGPDGRRQTTVQGQENSEQHRDGERWPNPSGANARSVWQIPTEPTPFAHFATWPQALVRRMIQAGTSERGVCGRCGSPWVRYNARDVPVPHVQSGSAARGICDGSPEERRPAPTLPRVRRKGTEASLERKAGTGARAGETVPPGERTGDSREEGALSGGPRAGKDARSREALSTDESRAKGARGKTTTLATDRAGSSQWEDQSGATEGASLERSGGTNAAGLAADSQPAAKSVSLLPEDVLDNDAGNDGSHRPVDEGRTSQPGEHRGGVSSLQLAQVESHGWRPTCSCDSPVVPATILDPFAGSGTTCLVARNHGRHAIGIELNEQYLEIARTRLQQLSLLAT